MFWAVFASARAAFADVQNTTAAMSWGTLLIEATVLLIAGACVLTVFKVYAAVRGGRIAHGWRWLGIGFGIFVVSQALLFANAAGLLPVSDYWIGLLRIVALLFLLVGATRIRKLLT